MMLNGQLFELMDRPICDVFHLKSLSRCHFATADECTTAGNLAEVLVQKRTSGILVAREGFQGYRIFTEADLRHLSPVDWHLPVWDRLTQHVVTVAENDPVRIVYCEFQVDGKRHLPVVVGGMPTYMLRPRSLVRKAVDIDIFEKSGIFDSPARDIVQRADRFRREKLRVSENSSIRDALEVMRQYHGSAVRIPERGAVTALFTERDLVNVVSSGISVDAPIMDVATKKPLVLRGEVSTLDVIETMGLHDIRHVLIDDDLGQSIVIPRDIIQLFADLDPSTVAMPANVSSSLYGG